MLFVGSHVLNYFLVWLIFSLFLFAHVRVYMCRSVSVYVPPPCPVQKWHISYAVLPWALFFFSLQCAMKIALYQGISTFCTRIFSSV